MGSKEEEEKEAEQKVEEQQMMRFGYAVISFTLCRVGASYGGLSEQCVWVC